MLLGTIIDIDELSSIKGQHEIFKVSYGMDRGSFPSPTPAMRNHQEQPYGK
jgi:hypothetical protein